MREINLNVNFNDKSLTTDSKILACKGDNGITKINVSYDELFPNSLNYRYLCIKNPNFEIFWVVDISNTNFVVSSFYSWKASDEYRILIFASDTELTAEDIQRDATNYASNEIKDVQIIDNFLEEPFEIRPNEEAE